MKLVLCSEGFHIQNTVQACVNLCDKPQDRITVAVISEAYAVEQDDKKWVLKNLNDVSNNFPARIDIVNLLALSINQIEQRIGNTDVIFVIGGSTDYLLYVYQKTGFANLLPKLLETKVYVGSSAGSMVIGRRISTEAYREIYQEDDRLQVKDYLGLVNYAMLPHLSSANYPNNKPEVLERVTKGMPFPVYALKDDSAIVVNGSEQTFIGSKPYTVKS